MKNSKTKNVGNTGSTGRAQGAARTDSAKNDIGIIPLQDRIVVKPDTEAHTKTASGIIIPDTVSKEKPEQGTVVAVGPGKLNEKGERTAVAVKPGDKVLFSKYGFDEVTVDGQEYFILREDAILAVMKGDGK